MSIRRLPELLLAVLLVTGSAGQAADDSAAERQRIERERVEVDTRARSGEAACAERFAVSACLAQVRAERRAAMQKLDHQRALLDDAQRKRRASERQARIRERQDAAARADEARVPPSATAPSRAAAPASPPASAAQSSAATQPDARRRSPAAAASENAAATRRAAASKQRAEEAAKHREAVEQKNREHAAKRPPAPALPVPATNAASAAVR
jgi:colicin import membrane protein